MSSWFEDVHDLIIYHAFSALPHSQSHTHLQSTHPLQYPDYIHASQINRCIQLTPMCSRWHSVSCMSFSTSPEKHCAPSREEFITSFRMMQDLMDQGDAILATRHARQSLHSSGSIVDGLVPVGGGRDKRILSRGEAVSRKKKKKSKKQKLVTAFVRPAKSL